MPKLNISKVAVGCASLDSLRRRQHSRLSGGEVPITTRFRPKRAEHLIGGSIYWIIKHRLIARQAILGFATSEADQKTIIRLDPELVAVKALPKRAHQGWRYLEGEDSPPDIAGDGDGSELLPLVLAQRLAVLALI